MTLINVLAAWLLADFITGLVHWFEDKYLDESTQIGRDNILHHNDPRAMTRISKWENIRGSVFFGVPGAIIAWAFSAPLWFSSAFLIATMGNLVHRYAHEVRSNIPAPIRLLQRLGLMLSPRKHMKHHKEFGVLVTKERAYKSYCAMTDWLNPVLDYFKVWRGLEFIINSTFKRGTVKRG